MHDALRHYYLEQMGIKQWVVRAKPIAAQASVIAIDSEAVQSPMLRTSGVRNDVALNQLSTLVAACTRCPLHQTRTQTVFARGNPQAKLMIVGEAPGFYEDKQGQPFVGKAGQLFDQMLASIGFNEETAYIANVLKCRPPNNREPQHAEIDACTQYLDQQIALVAPTLILALGRFAGQFLLKNPLSLTEMRGKIHTYGDKSVIVSYHPAHLLHSPADKKQAYQDLLFVSRTLQT